MILHTTRSLSSRSGGHEAGHVLGTVDTRLAVAEPSSLPAASEARGAACRRVDGAAAESQGPLESSCGLALLFFKSPQGTKISFLFKTCSSSYLNLLIIKIFALICLSKSSTPGNTAKIFRVSSLLNLRALDPSRWKLLAPVSLRRNQAPSCDEDSSRVLYRG